MNGEAEGWGDQEPGVVQGGLAKPVLDCRNVHYATLEITFDFLDRPRHPPDIFIRVTGMTSAILGWEGPMGVAGGATHGTSQLSSRSLYPVLGVQEGIRLPSAPAAPPYPEG